MQINELILAPGETCQAWADDGFFFSAGAFETIAVSGRVPIALSEHLTRMERTLGFFGINAKQHDLETLVLQACATLDSAIEWALKLTVTERNRIVSLRQNPYTELNRKQGFVCDFSMVHRNESSPLSRMKTLAYAENIIEKRRAQERGVDEPLFLNARGEVAEGAVSNVFAVEGEVVTPPVSCGLLPGIMRQFAIKTARAAERPLLPADLTKADEVFLTNSLMGAMPVIRLDEARLKPGPVARMVNRAYAEETKRQKRVAEQKPQGYGQSPAGTSEGQASGNEEGSLR